MSENDSKLYTGLDKHAAITNKWIGYVPLESILGKQYSNLELNLTRFSMPSIQLGSSSVSFKGYSVEVPTHVLNADTKEIVWEYIVDERFDNYAALYSWASGIGNLVTITDEDNSLNTLGILSNSTITCRVWLLDSYKNMLREFVFNNCWIKQFNELTLEYASANEVHHSITLAYSDFTVSKVTIQNSN